MWKPSFLTILCTQQNWKGCVAWTLPSKSSDWVGCNAKYVIFKDTSWKKILHIFCWCGSIISNNNSKPVCTIPPSFSKPPLLQCSVNVNIIPQDQIDDEPIRFITPTPPLRNQLILATAAISVSTTYYSSQYFLTMNSPMLSSKPTALETKMCGKMMVITFYFKDELQSLKNDHYATNWSMHSRAILP